MIRTLTLCNILVRSVLETFPVSAPHIRKKIFQPRRSNAVGTCTIANSEEKFI
ncbi:hypothetical protein KIN20_015612 [Parelaphostrongylus tenuis]|uniref:Uncharacterized protein n=1 Tax=Parelaphostrongylus tenuis TaxID=148309 RepID=A0AAD5MYQ5_PARTN|nr:hypothetical protein KIN20_015612 [Parelaphostrongylus tenuis]